MRTSATLTSKQDALASRLRLLQLPTSLRFVVCSVLLLSLGALLLTTWSIVPHLIHPRPSNPKAWAQAMRLKEEAKEAAKSGRKNDAEELFKQATQWAEDLSNLARRALALSTVARAEMSSDRIAGLQVFERAIGAAEQLSSSDRVQYLGEIALDLAMAGEGQRARDLLKGHDDLYFSRIATEQAKAGDFAEALKTVSTMSNGRTRAGVGWTYLEMSYGTIPWKLSRLASPSRRSSGG